MPGMQARCATLVRPLDPSGEVEGEIELRFAVVPALDLTPEPDPLVPLAGGPGQGAVQFYAAFAGAFEQVRRDRDILLGDQRGTGQSATMDCEFDDDIVEGQYSTEQTIEYMRMCLDQLPHDPRFFTTSVAVRDLEARARSARLRATESVRHFLRLARRPALRPARYPGVDAHDYRRWRRGAAKALGPEIATESQKAVDNILGAVYGRRRMQRTLPRKSTGLFSALSRS